MYEDFGNRSKSQYFYWQTSTDRGATTTRGGKINLNFYLFFPNNYLFIYIFLFSLLFLFIYFYSFVYLVLLFDNFAVCPSRDPWLAPSLPTTSIFITFPPWIPSPCRPPFLSSSCTTPEISNSNLAAARAPSYTTTSL